ncbi:MAG: WYL domain-containing protein [Candidatus Obscuribacterales bacterium]|nr:WYL domain-containing protein [Candidatus Obscuribacterales bacterium]
MSTNLHRLGAIIKIIGKQPGITLSKVVKALNDQGVSVTERTVAKDILILKNEMGMLPRKDRLRSGYLLSEIFSLSDSELDLVLDAMHTFGAKLSDEEATAMRDRLIEHIKETGGKKVPGRSISHRTIYKKTKDQQEIEKLLLASIRQRLPAVYTYKSPRIAQPERCTGYPLLMLFHERGWYCIFKDQDQQRFHPRRMDRISECAQLPKALVNNSHEEDIREAQFLVGAGWGMSFPRSMKEYKEAEKGPRIVARFDRTKAGYILEAMDRHPLGKVIPAKDGTGEVEFHIKLSNPEEFLFWVRSFGSKAWIVEPESLREKEKNEIRRMGRRYED